MDLRLVESLSLSRVVRRKLHIKVFSTHHLCPFRRFFFLRICEENRALFKRHVRPAISNEGR